MPIAQPARYITTAHSSLCCETNVIAGLTEETAAANPETASMLQRMRQIGRRTAELHLAPTSRSDIAAFAYSLIYSSVGDIRSIAPTMKRSL
jgi:hypothetical protein